MSDDINKYREDLVKGGEQAQASLDKTLIAISGGAFTVSLLFTE